MEFEKLLLSVVGSHSFGTNIETSDIDYTGIYLQPKREILSIGGYKEQIPISKDFVYHEIRKFMELLLNCNPTSLELIHSSDECIKIKSDKIIPLLENKNKFLTKKCKLSYGNYAIHQLNKAKGLDKFMNWDEERLKRKTPIDFCYVHEDVYYKKTTLNEYLTYKNILQEDCFLIKSVIPNAYHLFTTGFKEQFLESGFKIFGIIDENSNEVRFKTLDILHEIKKKFFELKPKTLIYYNKDAYSKHCSDYNKYQDWLKNRNVSRYVDVENHGQKIDGKNLLHARRLLDMAIEIGSTGQLINKRPNSDYLISIRKGKYPLEKIIEDVENDIKMLDSIYENNNLPEDVDLNFVNDLLLEIREVK